MKRYIRSAVTPVSNLGRDDRCYAARHSDVPAELESLSHDDSEYVRSAVAKNPNTPLKIVERLVGDAYSNKVSDAALSNKAVTPEVLISWIDNSYPIVVWRIANNRKTPTEVLQYIINNYPEERGKLYAKEELECRSHSI